MVLLLKQHTFTHAYTLDWFYRCFWPSNRYTVEVVATTLISVTMNKGSPPRKVWKGKDHASFPLMHCCSNIRHSTPLSYCNFESCTDKKNFINLFFCHIRKRENEILQKPFQKGRHSKVAHRSLHSDEVDRCLSGDTQTITVQPVIPFDCSLKIAVRTHKRFCCCHQCQGFWLYYCWYSIWGQNAKYNLDF